MKKDVLCNDVVLTDKRCVLPIAKQLRCRFATSTTQKVISGGVLLAMQNGNYRMANPICYTNEKKAEKRRDKHKDNGIMNVKKFVI